MSLNNCFQNAHAKYKVYQKNKDDYDLNGVMLTVLRTTVVATKLQFDEL